MKEGWVFLGGFSICVRTRQRDTMRGFVHLDWTDLAQTMVKRMKILAILQNQWFKDPEGIKQMYEENPERRNRYIQAFLFMGCLTGRRLQQAFGEELCNDIIWEEASPKIAGKASACFPPDPQHICNALLQHRPGIVLTFGKIATDGILVASKLEDWQNHADPLDFQLLSGPHPAARTDPMPRLKEMAERVKLLIKEQNNV